MNDSVDSLLIYGSQGAVPTCWCVCGRFPWYLL